MACRQVVQSDYCIDLSSFCLMSLANYGKQQMQKQIATVYNNSKTDTSIPIITVLNLLEIKQPAIGGIEFNFKSLQQILNLGHMIQFWMCFCQMQGTARRGQRPPIRTHVETPHRRSYSV